ncbi:type II toxin-antitoxin system Phd/YefM family antitoxin [Streptomyces zhihengii]
MNEQKVREMGVSEARANMTEVIAEARLLDVDFVLTRRDKPQAVLMSVKRYEQAKMDARVAAALTDTFHALSGEELKANPVFEEFAKRFLDV